MKNKYWLNEYGERYWYKKSDITITACRAYYWVDRVVFIHESSVYEYELGKWTTSDRHGKGETTYLDFKNEFDKWVPIENWEEYVEMLRLEYDAIKYNI